MSIKKVINLNKDAINKSDLSNVYRYAEWCPNSKYFNEESGKEHYRLLAYLSSQLESGSLVVDIGTYFGFSALALAANPELHHNVVSYDVHDWVPEPNETPLSVKTHSGVTLKLKDCVNDIEELIGASLIMLDIDPHDGVEERRIIGALEKAGFSGILVLDDTHLNQDMENLVSDISRNKYDGTKYGHWSGTTFVIFDPSKFYLSFS